MSNLPVAWVTPEFSEDDPIIPRMMSLRPSLWAVVFASLEDLARSWNWYQDDPTHATVAEVIKELREARTVLEKGPMGYIGEIREFATADPPEGWLRCNGAEFEITEYPLLAAAIHPNFYTDATHYRVPDRVQRAGIDGYLIASQLGATTHTLSETELTPHTHIYTQITATLADPGEEPSIIAIDDINDEPTGSTGGGEPFSILNPLEGTQFYIRAYWPTAG